MPDNDARQKMFADLTALFEDATGLAADGQAPVHSASQARAIAQEIRKLVQHATKKLDQLI
ncbi:MAG: hypothetical protein KUG69_11010 [Marinosulfonomonas sp.]|nr:hypothetical protein [Marinosulfonomonas sp.]